MIEIANFTRMKKNKKIFVIIPAFNEEHSIYPIVKMVLKHKKITGCVVVDDGSVDNTAILAKKAGATVLHKEINSGTGATTAVGLKHAINKNADFVILMDADGQHDTSYLKKFITLSAKNCGLIIGSRYQIKTVASTSILRQFGTKIISVLIHAFYNKKIYDPTSGFRLLNRQAIEVIANQYPVIFPEPEVILYLLQKHITIEEVPVQMKHRYYGTSSISFKRAVYLIIFIFNKIIKDKRDR